MRLFLIKNFEGNDWIIKKALFIMLLMFSLQTYGQDKHHVVDADYQNSKVEMADQFRADGKIYVVVAVASIILAGFFLYAFTLDRKISKLEKEFGPKDTLKKSY